MTCLQKALLGALLAMCTTALPAYAAETPDVPPVDRVPDGSPTPPAHDAPPSGTPTQPDEEERTTDRVEEELEALERELEDPVPALPAHAASTDPSTGASLAATVAHAKGLLNPDISLILNAALAVFSDTPMQLGAHDPNRNGPNFQQGELSMESAVDPYFRLRSSMVFSQFGVELEELYASTTALPWGLQARAGQFLTRFGRLNPTHPHVWNFLDQPLVLGKFFGGEASRGAGMEVSWLLPLPWYSELVGSTTEAVGECCARSFLGSEDLEVRHPLDLLYTVSARQFHELGARTDLLWGISAQFGPNPTGHGNRTAIYGVDAYLKRTLEGRRHVALQAEYLHRRREVPRDVLADNGLYAQLVVRFQPAWEVAARQEWVTGVQADPLDPEWQEARHRSALSLSWFPSHFSKIRLQAGRDDAPWREQAVWSAMLGLEVLAGAHGAHVY